ncbi:plasma-membrane calcium-translocating P-type ATPase [Streptoalloteichus tenebrarius]|uniref:Plasma-membrane calcium-translocating P-type ATPase n=1 Tax=Streptoalloteichus tenebrarius (strain ATCC 17920 / DSM 40477 / JCM 4838 / CBS 697.72 / NBRC 16177 / NCIMB 11028 / NRRL B-12390 / A12253. 1 / ISP 5477) TaxID=1933 RepID=A0ABT1HRQ5_STRSD|nr:HAD-IC family P-type ATPase [Streptoalloteichus tenebrarius]MCP2258201.1 plasma-membrane calcium-translocating P-type ATPase [Streptoalloteichus tenebrarius]BFF04571.1 cation-translocating P-type ATPase [Streptoalloteichus tenebrarius]
MGTRDTRASDPLDTLGALARQVAGATLDYLGRPRNKVWSCPGRLHVEAHGVHGPDGERVAHRIERLLERHPGVLWARVNAPASRVIIAVTDPPPRTAELVRIVARAEAEPANRAEEMAEDELHHPADGTAGTRVLPTLAVDAVGLALSAVTRLLPFTPLPTELAGLISAVDLHPRLREGAARRLRGHERADSVTSMAAALVHGLATGGAGTVLDVAQRVAQWREARAHQAAWCRAENELIRGPDDAGAQPMPVARGGAPVEGPAERYARRVLAAGSAASALTTPLLGPRRAAALGLAALPKATDAGRAAFAAHLGRVLARRGTLAMDRAVLRRLDVVDTVVIDETALRTGRSVLTDLVPLPEVEIGQVTEHAFRLFDADAPTEVRHGDGWVLGPVDELDLQGRKGVRERRRLTERGATTVLGLAEGRRLQAVLAATEEVAPGMQAVAAATRRAGLRLLVASSQPNRDPGFADEVIPHDGHLVRAVGRLQEAGHVVLLLSADRHALARADCGVGVHRKGTPPPWGAHLIVGADLEAAVLVVEAVAAARQVTRDGTRLSQISTGIGTVLALRGGQAQPSAASLRAVNTGAALAFADGLWRAHQLHTRQSTPVVGDTPWHLMPPEAVLRHLRSGSDGLSAEEVRRRWRATGGRPSLGTSLGSAFLEELANPLTPVLAGGAALSAAVGSPADAALVAGVVVLSAWIGTIQRVRTDRALADLLARSAVGAKVRRDGVERVVTAEELVSGDVVLLAAGDVVPADCRLVEASGLEVDESSLTGESLPVAKDPAPVVAADLAERRSMLYEGTTVAAGHATAVVVATGEATEVGRSMAAARQGAPTTGVEARLGSLGRMSVPLAVGSAAAVSGAGLLRGAPLRDTLGAAVNLAVASVPEGLPFLVNAAQLAAARRLADRGALVRNPRTIEALGRVDVLCFDKTGTLTEGRLRLSEVDDGRRTRPLDQLDSPLRTVLAAGLRATPQAERPEELAHHTDRAVVEGARAARVDLTTAARGWRKVETVPFEPSRGYHASVGRANGHLLLSVKGAPEVILPRCRRQGVGDDQRPLDERGRRTLAQRAERLAGAGRRVLAVAENRGSRVADDAGEDLDDLTFLGFLTLADPVRGSAAPAAAKLREAGVQIVMVTGDHPATADAIAATVRSDGDEGRVVTGAEIDELDDRALDELLPTVDVIARCSPSQKVRIIQAYQRLGRVVAMTGDGANDAPAIRLADVGIALGRRGTPAARAAADLVVTDDRLETVIAALVEGRAMWSSVRKALAVLIGGNLGEIAFTVLGAAITGRSPLNARQLLLVNLLTDLAPALAIALRPPPVAEARAELLREGPDTSLGVALNRDVALRAAITTLGATGAWVAARLTGRSRRASTVALAALVGTQLGQTVVTGGLDRKVIGAGLGSAAVLAAAIQTPGVSRFFGCTPLGPVGWGIAGTSATTASLLGALLGGPLRWAVPRLEARPPERPK